MFDETAVEYDELYELSYAWSYSRLHAIIAKQVIRKLNPSAVLDIACGTGLQTYLYAAGNASVTGIDVSKNLICNARAKKLYYNRSKGLELFPVYFDFVKKYNKRIAEYLNLDESNPFSYPRPTFLMADAARLPFDNGQFDHVNFVGALSFMENYDIALSEATRVLKPGGTLFLEVESRWNPQLFWRTINYLLNDRLGDHSTFDDIRKLLFTLPFQSVPASYPLKAFGQLASIDGRFFTFYDLRGILKTLGFDILGRWPIHTVTHLIPWAYLNIGFPSEKLEKFFLLLASVEEKLPFFFPGSELAILAQNKGLSFKD